MDKMVGLGLYRDMDNVFLTEYTATLYLFIHRPLSWIKDMKMGAFVGVAKGSVEEPYLLEMKYSGGLENQSCTALVGKGK